MKKTHKRDRKDGTLIVRIDSGLKQRFAELIEDDEDFLTISDFVLSCITQYVEEKTPRP